MRLAVFSILVMMYLETYCQGVSIDLEMNWERIDYNLSIKPYSDSSLLSPILYLKYTNHSVDSVFVPRLWGEDEYPYIFPSTGRTSVDYLDGIKDLILSAQELESKHYIIMLGCSSENTGTTCMNLLNVLNYNDRNPNTGMETMLHDVNSVFQIQHWLDESKSNKKLHYFGSDSTLWISFHDAIMHVREDEIGSHKNSLQLLSDSISFKEKRFVFLNPNQTVIQKINLVSLLAFENTYTISMAFLQPRWINSSMNKKTILPTIMDGYKLYEGEVRSNNITISTERVRQ